jgi:hypothetical protein
MAIAKWAMTAWDTMMMTFPEPRHRVSPGGGRLEKEEFAPASFA